VIELNERVAFLDKIHLFSGLDPEKLAGISRQFKEVAAQAGEYIIKRGDKANGFFMVFKGSAKVTVPDAKNGGERRLAILVSGDYFGEEALFENRTRNADVIALEDCEMLFLSREGFEHLITQYSKLEPNFKVAIESHKLARATNFKWLGKNEVIYFIARREKLLLYRALIAPVFSLAIPIALIFWSTVTGAVTPMAVGLLGLIGVIGWGVWNAIDWSNDYYIVTNQRVVWLEKVIFLYDSREEAPLASILSVGVETDMLGRIFDFGNVIVRTYVGKLEFEHVNHPLQAADMIREYWERTKAVTRRSQMDVMKDTIKQKLNIPINKKTLPDLAPLVTVDEAKIAKTSPWILALQNFFQLRYEEAGKVIYRKHWIVLFQNAWRPVALFFGGIGLFLWRLYFLAKSPTRSLFHQNAAGRYSPDIIVVMLPVLLVPVIYWLWYEYTDWKNDTFMVTSDEIHDIDRKPWGKEERRTAQIESILSTSYARSGFIPYIFNYGTVNITVGGSHFAFQDVMDPASVQADINRRRSARIAKKNEDAGKEDRERFATWVAAYHQNQSEFNLPANPAPPKPEEVKPPEADAVKTPHHHEEEFGDDEFDDDMDWGDDEEDDDEFDE